MKASPHFTIEELTFSETATRKDINNTPSQEVLDNLLITAWSMENVRELLNNNPILISSGYRCLALLEFDKWVHIAFPENGKSARKKALIINKKGTMIYSQ